MLGAVLGASATDAPSAVAAAELGVVPPLVSTYLSVKAWLPAAATVDAASSASCRPVEVLAAVAAGLAVALAAVTSLGCKAGVDSHNHGAHPQ